MEGGEGVSQGDLRIDEVGGEGDGLLRLGEGLIGAVLFEELVGALSVVEAGGERDVEVADVDVDAIVDEGPWDARGGTAHTG